MLMRAIVDPANGSRSRVSVKFDPWEEFVKEHMPWPGTGHLHVNMWYALNPPPEFLADMVEVGTEGEFTLFRRPVDTARLATWEGGDKTQAASLSP
jgi:hypothetical protein